LQLKGGGDFDATKPLPLELLNSLLRAELEVQDVPVTDGIFLSL
jgi:hypothetical protein